MVERFPFPSGHGYKSPTELNRFLGNSLSAETMYLLSRARKKGMPFFVTPYYLHLLNPGSTGYNDESLRSYILYSPQLVETYGQIRAWEREDIVKPENPMRPAGSCRRTQYPPSLSGSSHPHSRHHGTRLWRALCFLPAHV